MVGPLYRQISMDLRRRIEVGELAPEDQLPTEDELIDQYKASRNTVRAAIKELVIQGLVETLHGRGTFVVEQVKPIVTTLTSDPESGSGGGEGIVYTAEVAKSGRTATTGDLHVSVVLANRSVADELRIGAGDNVISRSESRFVDGRPWSRQTSYYLWALAAQAPRLLGGSSIEEGTVAYLRANGVHQAGYRDGLAVRTPDPAEIAFFGLPVDGRIPVVEIYRVAFDQHEKPYRLTVTVYRADRNRFVIDVGGVPISENLRTSDR